MSAVISQDGRDLFKLPLREGRETVHWNDVSGLPAQGLEPGSYKVRLRPSPEGGNESADFTVVSALRIGTAALVAVKICGADPWGADHP